MDLSAEQLGNRLKQARLEAGVDLASAAAVADVTEATLNAIEAGQKKVRLVTILSLAELYGREAADVIRGRSSGRQDVARFRAHDHQITTAQAAELTTIFAMMDAYRDLWEAAGPDEESDGWRQYTAAPLDWAEARAQGSRLALDARSRMGLSYGEPVQDVGLLAAVVHVPLFEAQLPEGISGVSDGIRESRPLIAVSQGDMAERRRFSVSHELAHHILGDGQGRMISTWFSRRLEETRADTFAGTFLIPEKAVEQFAEAAGKAVAELHFADVADLSLGFGISYSCAAYRLFLGGWIDRDAYEKLIGETRRANGRRKKEARRVAKDWNSQRWPGLRTSGLSAAREALAGDEITESRFAEYVTAFGFEPHISRGA